MTSSRGSYTLTRETDPYKDSGGARTVTEHATLEELIEVLEIEHYPGHPYQSGARARVSPALYAACFALKPGEDARVAGRIRGTIEITCVGTDEERTAFLAFRARQDALHAEEQMYVSARLGTLTGNIDDRVIALRQEFRDKKAAAK